MTTQIAVKLPDDTITEVDRLVKEGHFASRSDAVRTGLALALERRRREEIDEAYVRGYTLFPETEEELAQAERNAIESIEEEPWEKWW